jgi:hypothetical protein
MPTSGMLRLATLVRTDVSEELSASIIRVTRIGELGTLAVSSNRALDRTNALSGSSFTTLVSGIDPKSVNVRFMVYKVELKQVIS